MTPVSGQGAGTCPKLSLHTLKFWVLQANSDSGSPVGAGSEGHLLVELLSCPWSLALQNAESLARMQAGSCPAKSRTQAGELGASDL